MVIIMKKKWLITDENIDFEVPGVDPLIQKILAKRGISGEKEIKGFLYGRLEDLYDPFLMADLDKAVKRIITAVEKKEKVIIYGDYDVDGITSTTLLYTYFKQVLGMESDYYIPDRLKEGYGLNSETVEELAGKGYDLLITVDCGISAIQEVDLACSLGLDIIITDHHQPGDNLPDALAVVDPHRIDDNYPFKFLAGVGVAFKLCQGIEKEVNGQGLSSHLKELLDLVTLGSIADIVPLRGENRIIVREGLKIISETNNPGLKVLIDKVGLADKELNAGQIGYILAPPLNAAGRMKDSRLGVRLLTTDSRQEAVDLAGRLVSLNKDRQAEEERIYLEAREMVDEIDLDQSTGIVLASSNWHHGVIGIVASRLVEKYYRPTILIAVEEGRGKGSCRSISSLNIFQALKTCSDDLTGFGGHAMAAGLEIDADRIDDFRKSFNNFLADSLSGEDLIPRLYLDSILDTEDIDLELYRKLEILQPFGVGNPKPKFCINNIRLNRSYSVGRDGKHLKFNLKNGPGGIGFGFGQSKGNLDQKDLDLAFTLSLNEWNGTREVQIRLEDYNIRNNIEYFPITFKFKDWFILDKRGCGNHYRYLEKIFSNHNRTAVYINNFSQCENFRDNSGLDGIFINNNRGELDKFLSRENGILLFTNTSFPERINIDDLVFSSLPFSIREMTKILDIFTESRTNIHLLFGEKEVETNKRIIKGSFPDDEFLRRFYLYLSALPQKKLLYSDIKEVVAEVVNFSYDRRLIDNSLNIFAEIGLLDKDDERFRLLAPPDQKLDLSDSISYNNTIDIVEDFKDFVDLITTDNLSQLFLKLKEGGDINGIKKNN